MPYIKQRLRPLLDEPLDKLRWRITDPGELNYCITRLCHGYLPLAKNYERFNATIGVLECAKQELYRREVAPYEDLKMIENGDVS
jgi:hypothetical protein